MSLRLLSQMGISLLWLLSTAWAALAIHYQFTVHPLLNTGAVVAWLVFAATGLLLFWMGWAKWALLAYGLALALLLGWWWQLQPSNDRDWAADVARYVQPQIQGDEVVLRNVRNFDWRSDSDFTPRWEERRYDLKQLRSVDMAVSYWMGPAIAHTLVSFGFEDAQGQPDYLTYSIEIRKERHEQFSALAGFFKQFELSLIAGDERDLLRVRTNVRDEDVYLYRVQMSPQAMRSLFLAYLAQAQALEREPRFYNTLTANCTTIVYEMAKRIVDGLPLDWRLLASGYLPEYLYDMGALAPQQDLAALRSAGRITLRAQAADQDPHFSQAIRAGIPGMPEATAP